VVYTGYFADPFVWGTKADTNTVGTGAAEAEGQVDKIGDASDVNPTSKLRLPPAL